MDHHSALLSNECAQDSLNQGQGRYPGCVAQYDGFFEKPASVLLCDCLTSVTLSETRWKALEVHGYDPGEIYGHTIVFDPHSEALLVFGGCSRVGAFHNNIHRFDLRTCVFWYQFSHYVLVSASLMAEIRLFPLG